MAYLLFITCMLFIYIRPFSLPIWFSSVLFAFLAYILSLLSFDDIIFVFSIVTDSTVALLALILLSMSFDKLGFFAHLASFIAFKKISSFSFFLLLSILTSFVSFVFANDGAILVLTPIIYILFSNSKFFKKDKASLIFFLLCLSFLSDFASNLFIFSNLTNIITVKIFDIALLEFTFFMLAPQLFAILAFLLLAYLPFRKKLPRYLYFNAKLAGVKKKDIVFCYALLVFLLIFLFLSLLKLYISLLIASFIAFVYAFLSKKFSLVSFVKQAPFSVLAFSLGLFVVVFTLKNAGLLELLSGIFAPLKDSSLFLQIFSVGFFSAFASSFANNLPAVFLGDLALSSFNLDEAQTKILAYANLLACNIGSKFTPIGSLATLLWLHSLARYGIKISFLKYIAFSFFITFFVLCASLLGLSFSVFLLA